ncbi:Thymidylate kinase [hydrothermal vent metagenome]|uniref:dTMP kinase n=1 Tax=hydrothermal vent metagenome TaxID=652676 RepID=A0A3B1B6P5_9ZZZZ
MIGKFITIEGGEGVGKSSNISFIEGYLRDAGKELLLTREPGGTELGESIRNLLLDAKNTAMCSDTELLLMFAARAQHLDEVIRPALAAGKWVICDRFTDATYAYQGGGRGIDESRIATLEQWVQNELQPDITFLLDMPVAAGLARASKRSTPDRFEQEKLAFFERVRAHYLARTEKYPARFRVVDAEPKRAKVQAQIQGILDKLIETLV